MWLDIATIVFACTAANHLGLIEAIEKNIGFKLPILDCCKCASFWTTLAYGVLKGIETEIFTIVAISFLAAWSAVWFELFMGFIDTLYEKCYDKLYDKATVSETDGGKFGAKTCCSEDSENKMS